MPPRGMRRAVAVIACAGGAALWVWLFWGSDAEAQLIHWARCRQRPEELCNDNMAAVIPWMVAVLGGAIVCGTALALALHQLLLRTRE